MNILCIVEELQKPTQFNWEPKNTDTLVKLISMAKHALKKIQRGRTYAR